MNSINIEEKNLRTNHEIQDSNIELKINESRDEDSIKDISKKKSKNILFIFGFISISISILLIFLYILVSNLKKESMFEVLEKRIFKLETILKYNNISISKKGNQKNFHRNQNLHTEEKDSQPKEINSESNNNSDNIKGENLKKDENSSKSNEKDSQKKKDLEKVEKISKTKKKNSETKKNNATQIAEIKKKNDNFKNEKNDSDDEYLMENLLNSTENINIYLKLNTEYIQKIHETAFENFLIYFYQLKNENQKKILTDSFIKKIKRENWYNHFIDLLNNRNEYKDIKENFKNQNIFNFKNKEKIINDNQAVIKKLQNSKIDEFNTVFYLYLKNLKQKKNIIYKDLKSVLNKLFFYNEFEDINKKQFSIMKVFITNYLKKEFDKKFIDITFDAEFSLDANALKLDEVPFANSYGKFYSENSAIFEHMIISEDNQFVYGSTHFNVYVYDFNKKFFNNFFNPKNRDVFRFALTSDYKKIALCNIDQFFLAKINKEIDFMIKNDKLKDNYGIKISHDDNFVLIYSKQILSIINLKEQRLIKTINSEDTISEGLSGQVALSTDNKFFIATENIIKIFTLNTGEFLKVIRFSGEKVDYTFNDNIDISENNELVMIGFQKKIKIWNIESRKLIKTIDTLTEDRNTNNSEYMDYKFTQFFLHSRYILRVDKNSLKVFEVESGDVVKNLYLDFYQKKISIGVRNNVIFIHGYKKNGNSFINKYNVSLK